MKVIFRTNIDCAQNFVNHINRDWNENTPMRQPLVGDDLVIRNEFDINGMLIKKITLEVCKRTWNGDNLEIELHLNHAWKEKGVQAFTKWVENRK